MKDNLALDSFLLLDEYKAKADDKAPIIKKDTEKLGNLANGTILTRFRLKGIYYDIYRDNYILWDGNEHKATSFIKKMEDQNHNIIKQWLRFYYDGGGSFMGDLAQESSTVWLGDDGYIYVPDVNTKTEYVVAIGRLGKPGILPIAIPGGQPIPPPEKPHQEPLKPITVLPGNGGAGNGGTGNGGAIVGVSDGPIARLSGFMRTPLFAIAGLGVVAFIIYKISTKKEK